MTTWYTLRGAIAPALFLVVAVSTAHAQATWTPPPPRNLRVVPPDVAPARLVQMMRGFTAALGVRCEHCHQQSGSDPRDLTSFDFASDAKPAKATARTMMQLVQRVNTDLKDVGAPRPNGQLKVGCYTCHRGDRVPAVSPPQ